MIVAISILEEKAHGRNCHPLSSFICLASLGKHQNEEVEQTSFHVLTY